MEVADQLVTAVDENGLTYVGRRDHLTPDLGFECRINCHPFCQRP